MFDDYNGYFKAVRTGAARSATVGRTCIGSMSLREEGARRRERGRFGRGPNGRTVTPKKQHFGRRSWRFAFRRRRCSEEARTGRYIRSIMALPKPEQDTWVAPGMSRAKSYVTTLSTTALSRLLTMRFAASFHPMWTSIISADRISDPGFT